jgi:hypothetical protein
VGRVHVLKRPLAMGCFMLVMYPAISRHPTPFTPYGTNAHRMLGAYTRPLLILTLSTSCGLHTSTFRIVVSNVSGIGCVLKSSKRLRLSWEHGR